MPPWLFHGPVEPHGDVEQEQERDRIHYNIEVNNSSRNTALSTAITLRAHISLCTIEGELLSRVYAVGNCRCDLASHLAQHLLTIHTVMAQISSMAVMVIKVFNIVAIYGYLCSGQPIV